MKKGLRLTSIVLLLTVLFLLGVRWAERDGRLDLVRARIDNSGLVDSVKVAELLRPYFGRSLLKLDADSLVILLSSIAGVDSAEINIRYPDAIVVLLVTREPAAVLAYSDNRMVPVTVSGDPLPLQWRNDQLPVITVVEDPEHAVIASALDLLIKMELVSLVSIQVSNRKITVTENDIRIVLNPEQATESWLRWRSINSMVTDRTSEVDLRFKDQAVFRESPGSTEET
ncbi:MAG: hypothetical protein KAH54_11210 [Candidatus Sabulitectum sp.]|nr:hypothetical protein [Candidatus Sabulitectum sp.]